MIERLLNRDELFILAFLLPIVLVVFGHLDCGGHAISALYLASTA